MKRFRSVLFMFAVTLAATALVGLVRQLNADRIETNRKLRFRSVVLDVLDITGPADGDGARRLRLFDERVRELPVAGGRVFAALDAGGRVDAYAFETSGPGFWGPISALVGVSADGKRIIDVAFFRHVETPGLGARMNEDWFRGQFRGLPLAAGGGPYVRLRPAGPGKASGELDAITGATQTSRAVESLLNRGFKRFLRDGMPAGEAADG